MTLKNEENTNQATQRTKNLRGERTATYTKQPAVTRTEAPNILLKETSNKIVESPTHSSPLGTNKKKTKQMKGSH